MFPAVVTSILAGWSQPGQSAVSPGALHGGLAAANVTTLEIWRGSVWKHRTRNVFQPNPAGACRIRRPGAAADRSAQRAPYLCPAVRVVPYGRSLTVANRRRTCRETTPNALPTAPPGRLDRPARRRSTLHYSAPQVAENPALEGIAQKRRRAVYRRSVCGLRYRQVIVVCVQAKQGCDQ